MRRKEVIAEGKKKTDKNEREAQGERRTGRGKGKGG